ncbi:hypothetical protein GOC72_28410 [Sinorhizobium medicae]|nr:hypothetical protein [Sinorhizobium meliloti]MDW9896350.1 hypothetical protein [Sinorhizobium meliloti]MDX0022274.1 hypothetical protein [Sinorhizobium meliloti]MDX0457331.1 hypothetical protein [Sinorhizobium medicae]
MITILASAVAKAVDPILILVVALMVANFRNIALRLISAVAVGIGYQVLLFNTSENPTWHASGPAVIAAVLAALFWTTLFIVSSRIVLPWMGRHFPERQPFRGLVMGLLVLAGLSIIVAPGAILATTNN